MFKWKKQQNQINIKIKIIVKFDLIELWIDQNRTYNCIYIEEATTLTFL